jgi:histidinol-phosphate aminotransferase
MTGKISTHRFFNSGTQRALYEKTDGYIDREQRQETRVEKIRKKYGIESVLRMDLGQNNDGCDISILSRMEEEVFNRNKRHYIKNYPDFRCLALRQKIGRLHSIPASWVLLSAGLEQMLSMIAHAFLERDDRVLVTFPTFFLFEEYSKRMGGNPIELPLLEEDGFDWTRRTVETYKDIIEKLHPKLIWIANPNNPTGKVLAPEWREEIVRVAKDNFAFIVMDEAYGEYTDPPGGVSSASRLLRKYSNLMVLRSFSKAYGLANLRVGYAMVNNEDIMKALAIHRPYYPITQFSYDIAGFALDRIGYLDEVRQVARSRLAYLKGLLAEDRRARIIDSDSSIVMIGREGLSSGSVVERLAKDGILVSRIAGRDGAARRYVRITLGSERDLDRLATSFKGMD